MPLGTRNEHKEGIIFPDDKTELGYPYSHQKMGQREMDGKLGAGRPSQTPPHTRDGASVPWRNYLTFFFSLARSSANDLLRGRDTGFEYQDGFGTTKILGAVAANRDTKGPLQNTQRLNPSTMKSTNLQLLYTQFGSRLPTAFFYLIKHNKCSP